MIVLGLDPGSEESAVVAWDTITRRPSAGQKVKNELMAGVLDRRASRERDCPVLVIEQTKGYTMPLGKGEAARRFFPQQVLDTAEWAGYFRRCWEELGGTVAKLDRRAVKLHLLGRASGTDAQVREALIDLIGPKGRKAEPGPTFGMRADLWSALAVAYVFAQLACIPAVAARAAAPGVDLFGRESVARVADDRPF